MADRTSNNVHTLPGSDRNRANRAGISPSRSATATTQPTIETDMADIAAGKAKGAMMSQPHASYSSGNVCVPQTLIRLTGTHNPVAMPEGWRRIRRHA